VDDIDEVDLRGHDCVDGFEAGGASYLTQDDPIQSVKATEVMAAD